MTNKVCLLHNFKNDTTPLISAEELNNNINSYFIIDARTEDQYKIAHIPGAVNIPFSQIESRITEIPKDKKIVVYCNGGNTGSKAQSILLKNNYSVFNLIGGFNKFKETSK
ncbi:rhodanese-like domain-containing protein [Cetobacterium sp. 8H]|uniref:rhodanese-like domain-containing protein n=1 Tax=Cetobacterium sp. 8H TaxID=2759681 RepID=UPI00163CE8B1|nr:rhodanese-like domain-containing protein [Cetobacterium sp. 8H]MBC2851780.1 rhodanese-like domain-containing protein [Cetobacterium sp. 8H]